MITNNGTHASTVGSICVRPEKGLSDAYGCIHYHNGYDVCKAHLPGLHTNACRMCFCL